MSRRETTHSTQTIAALEPFFYTAWPVALFFLILRARLSLTAAALRPNPSPAAFPRCLAPQQRPPRVPPVGESWQFPQNVNALNKPNPAIHQMKPHLSLYHPPKGTMTQQWSESHRFFTRKRCFAVHELQFLNGMQSLSPLPGLALIQWPVSQEFDGFQSSS